MELKPGKSIVRKSDCPYIRGGIIQKGSLLQPKMELAAAENHVKKVPITEKRVRIATILLQK